MVYFKKNFKFFAIFLFFFFSVVLILKSKNFAEAVEGAEGSEGNKPRAPVSGVDYVPGEVIIKLKENIENSEGNPQNEGSNTLGKMTSSGRLNLDSSRGRLFLYKVSSSLGASDGIASKAGDNLENVINSLNEDPRVEYAEPNYYLRFPPLEEVEILSREEVRDSVRLQSQEDPQLVDPNSLNDNVDTQSAPVEPAPDSSSPPHQGNSNNDSIVIAVIDSGIDIDNPYFTRTTQALWENPGESGENSNNNIDDDGNGYTDDLYGWNFVRNSNDVDDDDSHGTHTSGVILRSFYEHLSFFSIITASAVENPRVKIMSLKFLDDQNPGTTLRAAEAIRYAIRKGAKIINASWGSYNYSRTLHEAIVEAYTSGVLFVNSSGNESQNNDINSYYPGNLDVPNIISVASSNVSIADINQANLYENIRTQRKQLAPFSNYGVRTVHIAAPGSGIISVVPGNLFAIASGTSVSAGVVSGLAGRILSQYPNLLSHPLRETIFSESVEAQSLSHLLSQGSYISFQNIYSLSSSLEIKNHQPKYVFRPPSDERGRRDMASGESEGEVGEVENAIKNIAGCGIISKFYSGSGKGGGSNSSRNGLTLLFVIALVSLPFLIHFMVYRKAKDGRKRRKHQRFRITSKVAIEVGDKTFKGRLQTISLGGAQMNTNAILEQGGIVNMQISSIDGKEAIKVEGHIVWREVQKKYGIQFLNMKKENLKNISDWTKNLKKI